MLTWNIMPSGRVFWGESLAWLWINNSWSDYHSTLQYTKALINVHWASSLITHTSSPNLHSILLEFLSIIYMACCLWLSLRLFSSLLTKWVALINFSDLNFDVNSSMKTSICAPNPSWISLVLPHHFPSQSTQDALCLSFYNSDAHKKRHHT